MRKKVKNFILIVKLMEKQYDKIKELAGGKEVEWIS